MRGLSPLLAEGRGHRGSSLAQRLFSRRGGTLFVRNTIVSTFVFPLGLALLWLLVERLGVPKVPAVAQSFLVANSVHYAFGRTWIYKGTERRVAPGYAFFLINGMIGLAATVGLFAAFVQIGMHYLLARVGASVFVGLGLFALNAVYNFRSL